MLIISTVPEAIGLMLVGILLLGTWPAVWHQVEQSGRLPSHTFLDYSLTYLAFAAASALTLGQLGPPAVSPLGQSLQFLDQLRQDNWQMVLFALAGGTCLAFGDLALQYSIALCGLSVGPPILNSITLIVGVVLAYFLDGGINKPQLVFTGAAFAAVAVGLGAAAHVVTQSAAAAATATHSGSSSRGSQKGRQDKQLRQQKLQQDASQPEDSAHGCEAAKGTGLCITSSSKTGASIQSEPGSGLDASDAVMLCSDSDGAGMAGSKDCELGLVTRTALTSLPPMLLQQQQQPQLQLQGTVLGICSTDASAGNGTALQGTDLTKPAAEGQAEGQQHLQQQRSISAGRSSSLYLGLAVTVIGGIIYGCFMPAFQIAANDPFKLLQHPTPPLSVYTCYFYFAVGFTVVSAVVNAWLMYRPPLGIQPSSLMAYLSDNRGRALSIFSGVLAAAGDLTQFIGGQTAGYAAAMMVMAYPVVGVLWGLLRFKELRQRPDGRAGGVPSGLVLVVSQVVLYVLSVGLLSGSAELRGH